MVFTKPGRCVRQKKLHNLSVGCYGILQSDAEYRNITGIKLNGNFHQERTKNMIYKIKRFGFLIIFFGISFFSYSADPPPPDPPPCPPSGDPQYVGAPIEDGVPVVIGLALIFGALKLQQALKKLKEAEK
jgi:hypothetical protein